MQTNGNNMHKMKVFPKGQVVIPVSLRRKYNIHIGDQIEFISIQDGILLKPSKHKKKNRSLAEELFGMLRSYTVESDFSDKDEINKATENGFAEGWNE